ncbi:hypothetical protein M405DRAFT_834780 [Rhizopogon salebrosus TDB-379]|nr:hypothetical protein M405DRAFT_834780 [Rhizopogon salebrosus TDB-379]
MFLVNRYGNLVGQTYIRLEEAGLFAYRSRSFCLSFALLTSYFMILSSASIHILVLMRAWAIWGTRKRVIQILIMGYVGYVLMLMGATTYGINNKHVQFPHLVSVEICVGAMPNYVWLSHVASFVLDSLVFVLTMRSLRKYSTEFQHLYPSGLLHILVRDAVMFFVVSIFGDALTIVSWTAYSKDPRYFLAKAFSSPLLSVAGQRLVLNLKSLKTRTYTTNDLSHEVDRQLEAFAEMSITPDGVGDPESGGEASGSGNQS